MQVLKAPLGIQAPLLGNGGMGISRFLRPLITPLVTAAQFQLRVHRVPSIAFLPTSFFPDWEVSEPPLFQESEFQESEFQESEFQESEFQRSERRSATFSEEADPPVGHFQVLPAIERYQKNPQAEHSLINQVEHSRIEPRNEKSPSIGESPVQAKRKKSKSKAKPTKKDASKKVTPLPERLPLSRATNKTPKSQPNQDLQVPIESESQLEDRQEGSEPRVPFSAPALELETSEIQETEFDTRSASTDRKTEDVDEVLSPESWQPQQETERMFESPTELAEIPPALRKLEHSRKGHLGTIINRSETFQASSKGGDFEQGDREANLQNLEASQSLKSHSKKGSKRSPIEVEGLLESKKAEISQELELASEEFSRVKEDKKITQTEDMIFTAPQRSKNRRQDRERQAIQADLIPDSETPAVTKTPQKPHVKRQRNKTQKNTPKLSPSELVLSTEDKNLDEGITDTNIQRVEDLSQPPASFSQLVAGNEWDTELDQTPLLTEFEPLAERTSETPRVRPVSETVRRMPSPDFPNIQGLQSESSQELGDLGISVRRSGSLKRSFDNLANVYDSIDGDIADDLLEPFRDAIEQPKLEQPELDRPAIDRPQLSPKSPKIISRSAPLLTDRQNVDLNSSSSIDAPPEFVAADLPPQGFAVGGEVTTTAQPGKAIAPSDIIPVMLTPGEFVINARDAQKHLPLLRQINQSGETKTPTSSDESSQISLKPTRIQRQRGVPNLLRMETLGEQHLEQQSEWRSLQSGTFDDFRSSKPSPTYAAPPRIFRSKAPASAPSRSSPSHFSTPSTWTSVEDLLSSSDSYPSFMPEQNQFSEMLQPVQVIHRQAYQEFAEGGEVMAPTSPSRTETMTETIENSQSTEKDAEATGDIETLAQEIYQRLCRRLEIERERSGVYSGRSPW